MACKHGWFAPNKGNNGSLNKSSGVKLLAHDVALPRSRLVITLAGAGDGLVVS